MFRDTILLKETINATFSSILFRNGNGYRLQHATYGQEPTWRSEVVTSRQLREQIESTPIENRPYRPFHFYGNAVRRMHYRGYPLPLPRDFAQGFQAVFGRSSR